jgi:hypothetical protein
MNQLNIGTIAAIHHLPARSVQKRTHAAFINIYYLANEEETAQFN